MIIAQLEVSTSQSHLFLLCFFLRVPHNSTVPLGPPPPPFRLCFPSTLVPFQHFISHGINFLYRLQAPQNLHQVAVLRVLRHPLPRGACALTREPQVTRAPREARPPPGWTTSQGWSQVNNKSCIPKVFGSW